MQVILWLVLVLLCPIAGAVDEGEKVENRRTQSSALTEREQQFLLKNPVLRVHNEMDWPPFNFNVDGQPTGYSIDYMDLLAEKLGIHVRYISGPTWEEFLGMMKTGEVDVMLNIVNTRERRQYLGFTKPYLVTSEVIYARNNIRGIRSLDDLAGKTVIIPKGFFTVDAIRKYYPDINVITADNVRQCLEAVAFGRADATVGIVGVMKYIAQKNFIPNLVLAAPVNDSRLASAMSIAVNKRNRMLRDILQKGMALISEDEVVRIRQRWADRQVSSVLNLNREEQRFISAHPVIRAHVERDYAPFLFSKEGRAIGYGVDYMHLLAEKLGIDIEYKNELTWDEALSSLERREVDLVLAMVNTPERRRYTKFTTPFLTTYTGIAVRKENRTLANLDKLPGHRVGAVKGYWHADALSSHYPGIEVTTYASNLKVLEAVSSGEVDAGLGSNPVFRFLMAQNYMTDLTTQIVGDVDLFKKTEEALGVRSDWPMLRDLLNRAIASVTQDELVRLEQKWQLQLSGKALSSVIFSTEEVQYLKQRGEIKVCVEPDWLPYEAISERGKHIGISADYIRLLEGRLGTRIRLVPTGSWAESLFYAQSRKCDVLALATATPQRASYLNFTEPYLSFSNVIATRVEELYVESVEQLKGKRVGVVMGHSPQEKMVLEYPGVELVPVDSVADGLERVRVGSVFGFVGAVATIGQVIQGSDLSDVKIAGSLGFNRSLSVAVRSDDPTLLSVINKGLRSITSEERQEIHRRWIKVEYQAAVDYDLIIQITITAVLILAFLIYRNHNLVRYNKKVQHANMELAEAHHLLMEKRDELAKLSITDPLTQVFNRLKLDEIFGQEIQRAERYGKVFSVIMLDIDDFKTINDHYGHQMGDRVLVMIASVLKDELRVTDTLGRWGGEEFFLICPETTLQSAGKVAESLRTRIEAMQFPGVRRVTASFGVATYSEGEFENEMIGRADQALYRAKVAGKNLVRLSD